MWDRPCILKYFFKYKTAELSSVALDGLGEHMNTYQCTESLEGN